MTSKEDNLAIFSWIHTEVKSKNTDFHFDYEFKIGEKSEFVIRIKAGWSGLEDNKLESLDQYDKIHIEILEFPRVDPAALTPSSIKVPMPDGSDFVVNFNWAVGLVSIYPPADDRFSGQPWSKEWVLTLSTAGGGYNGTCYLIATPDIACDIIRYCQKLTGLKAFW